MEHPGNKTPHPHAAGDGPYRRLIGMAVLSYAMMYVLMYAMVDRWDNVFNNVNQVYMAGLMAAPMTLLELALMRGMYRNHRLNAAIAVAALLVMLACWIGLRMQLGVTDRQFVRSMVPHHAGAILMCGKNRLRDPDLRQLCREIVRSQEAEIRRMKAQMR